ncbi:YopX family protein [Hydrogenivirga sp.]
MREIKFRAKDKSGDWFYGYLCELHEFEKGKWSKRLAIQDAKNGRFFPIIPQTVGQFTGLRDKNGKEIYEGDIVMIGLPSYSGFGVVHKVVFEKGMFCIEQDGLRYTPLCLYLDDSEVDIEVIDNVYDNPELIPHFKLRLQEE